MIMLDQIRVLEMLCKSTGQWGMLVSFHDTLDEVIKAAPYLDGSDVTTIQILADGGGILLFDSEEEARDHFDRTVGDDGPTQHNSYKGPARVYALTCDQTGKCRNENT